MLPVQTTFLGDSSFCIKHQKWVWETLRVSQSANVVRFTRPWALLNCGEFGRPSRRMSAPMAARTPGSAPSAAQRAGRRRRHSYRDEPAAARYRRIPGSASSKQQRMPALREERGRNRTSEHGASRDVPSRHPAESHSPCVQRRSPHRRDRRPRTSRTRCIGRPAQTQRLSPRP